MDTGFKIMYQRKLKKMTQKELGDALGVTRITISNWERTNDVPLKKLKQLAEYFDVSLTSFLEE